MKFTTTAFPELSSWIGFSSLFDDLQRVAERNLPQSSSHSWPHYNIRKSSENTYILDLAVSGFSKDDLEITFQNNVLVIKGEVKPDPTIEYIYKGIAERSFTRTFPLAENVVVVGSQMINGLLQVFLENRVPQEKKIQKIEISDPLKIVKTDTKEFLVESK